ESFPHHRFDERFVRLEMTCGLIQTHAFVGFLLDDQKPAFSLGYGCDRHTDSLIHEVCTAGDMAAVFGYIKGLVYQTGNEGTVAGSPMSIRYHFSAHHPLPPGQPRIR